MKKLFPPLREAWNEVSPEMRFTCPLICPGAIAAHALLQKVRAAFAAALNNALLGKFAKDALVDPKQPLQFDG
jgi:hypothetical protein